MNETEDGYPLTDASDYHLGHSRQRLALFAKDSTMMCRYGASILVVCWLTAGLSGCDDQEPAARPAVRPSPAVDQEQLDAVPEVSVFVNQLFEQIAAGNIADAYGTQTTVAFRETATREDFQNICDRVNTRLGALVEKQLQLMEVNPVGGSLVASATYSATFAQGAGTLLIVVENVNGAWLLNRLNVNAPELIDDPADFRQPTEILVVESDLVLPGSAVDVLDVDHTPPIVLIENTTVLHARWRISAAPAEGFVTLAVTIEQAEQLQHAGSLSIRRHADPADPDSAGADRPAEETVPVDATDDYGPP